MKSPVLRPRGIGEILDAGFQIYRSRWLQLVSATLLVVLPILVLEAVAPFELLPLLERLSNLFFLAASAAVVVIASGAYLGEDVDAMSAVRKVGRRFLSVWGAAFFQGLLVGLGLLLLIVPGVIAMAYTFAMQQAVMIEDRTTSDAWERSKSLARGHMKPILGTIVLAWLITFFAAMGISLAMDTVVTDVRMQVVLFNVVLAVLNPLAAAIGTVLYYDLRIRKEAFDVTVEAERLAAAEPVPAL